MDLTKQLTHLRIPDEKKQIMPSRDLVFKESLRCLRVHCHPKWGDRTALDVFNRLLAKHVRPVGWTTNTHLDIREDQISSRAEQWTVEALARVPRAHQRLSRVEATEPIIFVEYAGTLRLLDGNHRINSWIESRDSKMHLVHIHTVIGIGSFVELESIGSGG